MQSLEPEWTELFNRCAAAPPFLHPAWQITWWDVFGSCELHTLVLRSNDRLTALAACFLYGGRLVFLGNGISDQLGILAGGVDDARRMTEILREYPLDLQEVPEGSPLLLPHESCSVSPAVDLQQAVPKTVRRNVRTARRDLEGKGLVRVAFTASPDYLDDLFRLHAARWRSAGQAGVLDGDRMEQFHRRAAPALARAGLLRMHALLVDERPVGVVYAFARNGIVYSYLGGFDPEWQEYSPGTLSIYEAIEHARASGDRTFDFLRGAENYKYLWGAVDRVQYRLV